MPDVLIATNGFKGTWPAIEYGAWLAAALQSKVNFLAIREKPEDQPALQEIVAQAVKLFEEKEVHYSTELQQGQAEDLIPLRANGGNFITVVGPLGRPSIRRWLVGRSIRNFIEAIEGPILYVPKSRLPLTKMLICVGGLGYEVVVENLAFEVARKSNAEVTLLHVVRPTNLNYPASRAELEHWDHLVDTNTLPGRSLRNALETAESSGVKTSLITRQGKVEEEILNEIKSGNYDLICMGSPYSASIMRQLYTPNVTASIAEAVEAPLLTARHKP